MSLATEWVARIFAVSLLMFLPGVAGERLDAKFGTQFLALVGFGFGFCAGLAALLAMVKIKQPKTTDPEGSADATELSKPSDHSNNGDNGERE